MPRRTKWFDEFFIVAGADSIDQAVILATGPDARAWWLPYPAGHSESWNSTTAATESTASLSAASRSAADGAASTE